MSTTISPEERDEWRARHQPKPNEWRLAPDSAAEVCTFQLFEEWPCSTIRLLDALEAAETITAAAREVARVYRAGVTGDLTKALTALVAAVEETDGEA